MSKTHDMMVSRCRFKRTRSSDWEQGVAIGGDECDVDVIVTFDGQTVEELWTYQRQLHLGTIWIRHEH